MSEVRNIVGFVLSIISPLVVNWRERRRTRSAFTRMLRSEVQAEMRWCQTIATGFKKIKEGQQITKVAYPTLDAALQAAGLTGNYPPHKSAVLESYFGRPELLPENVRQEVFRYKRALENLETHRVACERQMMKLARSATRTGLPDPVCDVYLDLLDNTTQVGQDLLKALTKH